MNLSSLNFRMISFGEASEDVSPHLFWASQSLPSAHASHQLHVQVDKLGTPILMDLEDGARKIEWQTAVRRELADRATPDKITELSSLEPNNALQLLKVGDLANDLAYSSSSLRTLQAAVERILRRKTIFCMPPYGDAWISVAERIAAEVHGRLRSGQELSCSFVQLAPGAAKATSTRTMMEVLLKSLQSLVAESALKNMPINKPGPTLLEGETGTGKSFAAELFSLRGDRHPYYPVNLAAVNKELLESRLRGHVKGAFTGATESQKGWFEKANGGVLFLDELQSAGTEFQTQLLDLLDPSTNQVKVAKIGDDKPWAMFDVKVIIAVNEKIDTLIAEQRLRQDIFYRIRNIVRLPPLRDRFKVDGNGQLMQTLLRIYRWKSAPAVAQQNLRNMTTDQMERLFPQFSPNAIEHLQRHTWPGNLREFERVANDLYWEMEEGLLSSNRIDGADVLRAIDVFKIGATRSKVRQEAGDGPEDSVRREVQAALRTHHFVIKHVLPQLSRYKLSSYLALKTYLRDNEAMLDPDVAADSKVRRFLQKRPSATGSSRTEPSNCSAIAPAD